MTEAFDIVYFRGKKMDKKTRQFLQDMESKLGYELTVVQGCYAKTVRASANTHNLGGVIDLAAFDWKNKLKVAADLGGAAFHREYRAGLWGEHLHIVIRNHGNLDPSAAAQVRDWDHKPPLNGLVGHAPLTGQYHPGKEITFKYRGEGKPLPVKPVVNNVTKARDLLVESIHNIGEAAAFLEDTPESRKVVHAQLDELKIQHRQLRSVLRTLPKN